jgi:hypothetical protein
LVDLEVSPLCGWAAAQFFRVTIPITANLPIRSTVVTY